MTTALTQFGISLQSLKSEADAKVRALVHIISKGHFPERRKNPRNLEVPIS